MSNTIPLNHHDYWLLITKYDSSFDIPIEILFALYYEHGPDK